MSDFLLRVRTPIGLTVTRVDSEAAVNRAAFVAIERELSRQLGCAPAGEPIFIHVAAVEPAAGRTLVRGYITETTGSPGRMCRVCGCTELDACDDGYSDDGAEIFCHWIEENLCSACDGPDAQPIRPAEEKMEAPNA